MRTPSIFSMAVLLSACSSPYFESAALNEKFTGEHSRAMLVNKIESFSMVTSFDGESINLCFHQDFKKCKISPDVVRYESHYIDRALSGTYGYNTETGWVLHLNEKAKMAEFSEVYLRIEAAAKSLINIKRSNANKRLEGEAKTTWGDAVKVEPVS